MATLQECRDAFDGLAAKLSNANAKSSLDRSLSCTVKDLDVIFAGRFSDGKLIDIKETDSAKADIRLTASSDDLVALVAGELNVAKAWGAGRLKIDANMMDMLRLRELLA